MIHQKRGDVIFSPRLMKMATGILGMCVIGYTVGLPLYWQSHAVFAHSSSSCPRCHYDYCMKHDPEVRKEMEMQFKVLVADKLRQKGAEASENHRTSDLTLLVAKKIASQYQNEADKCNSRMETCEEARERAEEASEAQRKIARCGSNEHTKSMNDIVVRRACKKK